MNTTVPSSPARDLFHRWFLHGASLPVMALTLGFGALQRSSAAPPPNDNRASAEVIAGGSGRVTGSNVDATKEVGEANHGGNVGGKSIWYTYTAPAAGSTRFDTVGSDIDTLIAVYTAGGTLLTQNDEIQGGAIWFRGSGGYPESRVAITAVAGTTYLIAVDGYNRGAGAASGNIVLNWNQTAGVPPNDSFAAAIEVFGAKGGISGRVHGASKEAGEPNHGGNAGGGSIWYKWTPPISGIAYVDTHGSSFDTIMGVYTGAAVAALTTVGGGDDTGGAVYSSFARFAAVAGTTYYIAVDKYNNAEVGSASVHYEVSDTVPANDSFGSSIALAGSQGTVTGSNLNATKEAGEPNHAGNAGGRSVWYHWMAPASGQVTMNTFGPVYFDSLLGIYTGDEVTGLTEVVPGAATADDLLNNNVLMSRVSFQATAGTIYRIAVDGFSGAAGPASSDYSPFSLNWDLAVDAPTNDLYAGARVLPGRSGSVTMSNTNAVFEEGEDIPGLILPNVYNLSFGGKSLWFKWTAGSVRPVTFDTFGSSFDTTLAIYTGADLASSSIITNHDNVVSGGVLVSLQSSNTIVPTSGTTYYVNVDGVNLGNNRGTAQGTVVLNYLQVGGIPTNDNFANATVIMGNSGRTNGSTIDATAEVGEPEHGGITPSSTVWYKWTAPRSGWITFDTLPSPALDTVLAAYTGDSLDMLTEISANDDAVPLSVVQSSISFRATADTMYRIVVDTKAPAQGDMTLRWRPTVSLTGVRQPDNHLQLTIVAAAAGFYELQESSDLITWTTFDSVQFTDPSGGSTIYDAGDIAAPAMKFFRVRQ